MSYQKATITGNSITINFNTNLSIGKNFYTWLNIKESLSALTTRRTEVPKQADHGVEDSLSHYGPRFFDIEGEIHATSVAQRVTMERNLRRCLSLKRSQSRSGDDGYILMTITDDDAVTKQCYAKVIQMPEFSWITSGRTAMCRFRFAMVAIDPFLYSTTLKTDTGAEGIFTTGFTLQDGSLMSLQDGDLPSLQESVAYGVSVTNAGTIESAPLITVYGPSEDPIITNQTTGQTMDLTGLSILADERVEIDVAAYSITHFDDAEAETDASGHLSSTSEWIYIAPGQNNIALVDTTPDDLSSLIQVDFRDTYI